MKRPSLSTLLKPFLFHLVVIRLTQGQNANTAGNDTLCLQTLKKSISDPNGYLTSWTFNNSTQGFICKFTGVDCWNENENKVLNIRLSNMGLKGHFPSGLELCASLTGLDLSSNSFTGSIPANISSMVPYVTSIDLSSNSFTGVIPINLSLCQYLNTINLQHNSLTGEIPGQLATLGRLITLNVANNQLSGPVPQFKNQINADYSNNLALCGPSIGVECTGSSKKSNTGVIIGSAVGGIVVVVLVVGLVVFVLLRKVPKRKREEDIKGNKWARVLKGAKATKVLL